MLANQFYLVAAALGATGALATSYPVIESWAGADFFAGWEYPDSTYDNTTNGDVFWATSKNTSLLYISSANTAILKVDNTSFVPYNEKRYAPKILTKNEYDLGTVWVLDAVHMPYGCSVWPAFWTQGSDWPKNGEIDIVEGINGQTTNRMALHTYQADTCIVSNTTAITGSIDLTNCSYTANSGSGCTSYTTDTSTYGAGFAAAGGGVYVTEFASTGISIWFFSRANVPSSLSASAKTIDTSTLGTPLTQYSSGSCDMSTNFGPQRVTLDTTLCGSWAGDNGLTGSCALSGTNTCYTQFVINDAETTYQNAYWEINYVNIYSSSGANTTTTSDSAASSGAVVAGGVTASASSVAASSSSSAKSAAQRRTVIEGGLGVGAGAVAVALAALGAGMAAVL